MRWYLLTLLVSLTLLGLSQSEYTVPNQELVVQFSNAQISDEDADIAILDLKSQLVSIGAENIQVIEDRDGKLKISYFTAKDSEEIKSILSEEFEVSYSKTNKNDSDHSKNQHSSDFYFDVVEIWETNDVNPISKGVVIDIKAESDRFYKPKHISGSQSAHSVQVNIMAEVEFSTYFVIALTIKQPEFKFPEVRAGPQYC